MIHLTALLVSSPVAACDGMDVRVIISTGTTITTTPTAGTG